jgi:hypothetical protein
MRPRLVEHEADRGPELLIKHSVDESLLVPHDVEQRRDKIQVLLLAAAFNMNADDDKLFRVFTPPPTCRRTAGSFAGNAEPNFFVSSRFLFSTSIAVSATLASLIPVGNCRLDLNASTGVFAGAASPKISAKASHRRAATDQECYHDCCDDQKRDGSAIFCNR